MIQAKQTDTMDEHPWRDKETLQRLHHEERLTQEEIGDRLGCTRRTVSEWFSRHGIEARMGPPRIERVHYSTRVEGYEIWQDKCPPSRDDTCLVHRLAAVAWFGFDAIRDRHVHHKNGHRWDNRESNLELLTPSEHHKLHHEQSPPVGEDNPNAKLTWEDVREIRRRRETSSAAELAEEFGTKRGNIYSIWNRRIWKDDPRED